MVYQLTGGAWQGGPVFDEYFWREGGPDSTRITSLVDQVRSIDRFGDPTGFIVKRVRFDIERINAGGNPPDGVVVWLADPLVGRRGTDPKNATPDAGGN